MKTILQRLFNHEELTSEEACTLMQGITQGIYNESQTAALLTVFCMRDVKVNEILGFRNALLSTRIPIDFSAYQPIDIVGTGGDGKNTFNISTCASFIVAGAGPSLDRAVNLLQTCRRDNFYLLAVDAAALPLVSRGIVPDSIVAVESQYAITPAYYSLYGSGIPLIADLTSRPAVLRLTGGDITFFASQYCAESFFTRFEKLLHGTVPVVPPLGSVGLTAVYISLLLRSNTSVPVFICGLDFSYGTALTHSRGSSMHTNLLANSYRLQPEEQIVQRAFSGGAIAAHAKNSGTVYTTPALAGYAQLFREQFAYIPNLLDIGSCGLDLGIRQYTVSALPNFINSIQDISPQPENTNGITIDRSAIIQFFRTEQKCLERIRDIITDGAPLQELKELLAGREYLYLHFPDGYRLSLDTAFLRRIRAESGYFIKDCRLALQQL